MKRLGLLILMRLIESSCAAKQRCSSGTLRPCATLNGTCIDQDEECDGRVFTGKDFCKFTDKCKCCFPKTTSDCSLGTYRPCEALGGTCIGQDADCGGREITGEDFCKFADCKCCFPETCCPHSCSYQDQIGSCHREQPNNTLPVGPQECQDGCQCYTTDCLLGTNAPCVDLNGTCIQQDADCNGHVVTGENFCKFDDCKCCFPEKPESCCPHNCTYNDQIGSCHREQPDNTTDVGTQECLDGCQCYITGCIQNFHRVGNQCMKWNCGSGEVSDGSWKGGRHVCENENYQWTTLAHPDDMMILHNYMMSEHMLAGKPGYMWWIGRYKKGNTELWLSGRDIPDVHPDQCTYLTWTGPNTPRYVDGACNSQFCFICGYNI